MTAPEVAGAAAGRASTAHRVAASHDVSHLDSDLCPRNNSNRGSDYLGCAHHHHDHTVDSTDINQSEDHRELGDLWKPDHLAVATRRRTVCCFER